MGKTETGKALAGCSVWLTRPRHQAQAWAQGLAQAGAHVEVEPLLDIVPPVDADAACAALARAEQADIIIATSPNAVRFAWHLRPHFAPQGVLCAVGEASAAALTQAAGRAVQVPQRGDTSETLLAMPVLARVHGQRIALLSGVGGRRRLFDTLSARGARVEKVALYQRRPAAIGAQRLSALLCANDAAVVTSGQALQHLCALLRVHAQPTLYQAAANLQLVVPSRRVVQLTPDDLFRRQPRAVARMTVDAVVAALAPVWCGTGQ